MAKLFERKSTSLTISEFYDNYLAKKYKFDVSYQRKSNVWSEDKQSFLIDSILKNYPMPAIFLRPNIDTNTGRTLYDVVDGKQRLETIRDFIQNKITLTTYFAEDDFIDDKNRRIAEKISGLKFKEIQDQADLFVDYIRQFWTYALNIEYLYEEDRKLIATVFDRLNRNGEPLTRQELRKAKYSDTILLNTIEKLSEHSFWNSKLRKLKSKRMEDVEFISELFFVLLTDSINDSGADVLDDLYDKFKDSKEKIEQAEKEFTDILNYIDKLNIDFENNKRLCWATHLYTIFTFAWQARKKQINPQSVSVKIKEFYDSYYNRNIEYEGELKIYKEASSSRTGSLGQRKKRLKALINYCQS